LVVIGVVFSAASPVYAVTRTWDGGGTDGTCGGGAGDGNKWSCAANWSLDTLPGSSDLAVFDGTSTKDATIDSAINVGGIAMNAGYTGIITQAAGVTVTVGSQNFVSSAGTFTGGDSNMTVNGSFTVFRRNVYGRGFEHDGERFVHGFRRFVYRNIGDAPNPHAHRFLRDAHGNDRDRFIERGERASP
jgi:hypothetical protein